MILTKDQWLLDNYLDCLGWDLVSIKTEGSKLDESVMTFCLKSDKNVQLVLNLPVDFPSLRKVFNDE